ncbi:4-(cytidine 5'-diphospho)-2-C-methyl-D-erythritol kinase [Pseudooceanicola sediminis]|uniref:4-diphosphocytidyl-2-C-methyl-D-erythritol kinase n=1 Tax=Pseudooceanicola sediminis TaxID=2211117 RepID=A0A399J1Y1_9RHOB|nr:4-(cytidine 5'-diphospho)-2-C-methyl-D-erythritol kinase [Pseudooceanicola sediminis]KAA2314767.1 4-(cytidine 5'-diphospho)-2-C-methyl-D-erythritol kinase [Puniceibacterium sp. HSS470]RII39443.1 4-(cytidine 5'-diphospho)-2-C-methyl-D-erythritol kinase [Pseudooceanicola sediminis]
MINGLPDGSGLRLLAPAKVNLTLHVTGQRADGYHLLDSLVVFADHGDLLHVSLAERDEISVSGPRSAGVPEDDRNLCIRAARLTGRAVRIVLEKHLPNEAGLGGGSSDAAAVLRAIAQLTDTPLLDGVERIGADVPVCLASHAMRMRGLGEILTAVPPLPPLPAVLVNPAIPLATPPVFKALQRRDNATMPPVPHDLRTPAQVAAWLALQRNDLQEAAISIAPGIPGALSQLTAQASCRLARMSGSGASCFGLFDTSEQAEAAAKAISAAKPSWWVQSVVLK